jgi:hypothetical protein
MPRHGESCQSLPETRRDLIGTGRLLEEPEAPALLGPVERYVAVHQISKRKLGRLVAIDDGTRDVGSEIGQPDHAADIGPRAVVRVTYGPGRLYSAAPSCRYGHGLHHQRPNQVTTQRWSGGDIRCRPVVL